MGGAQFGLPGAIDRLRITDETALVILAASDPANAYGSVIPWPDGPGRPTRRAGARVAILDGQLIAWMDTAGKRTLIFTDELEHAARALHELAQRHGKASILEIDGESVHDHHLAPPFVTLASLPGTRGLLLGPAATKLR